MNTTQPKIITDDCLLSVVVITFGRTHEVLTCIDSMRSQERAAFEIILIDNNVDSAISDFLHTHVKDLGVRYAKNFTNLGVAPARNLGAAMAKGSVLIYIDDDAYFAGHDSFEIITQRMKEDDSLGVLTFKLLDWFTKRVGRKEFPFKNKRLDHDVERQATYFLGGACAIRKSAMFAAGKYCEDFFYGMEELDLSFRIIDAGFKILYIPSIVVWHKPSPGGRLNKKEFWQHTLENRLKVSMRNVPWSYFVPVFLLWSLKVLKESRSAAVLLRAYAVIFRKRRAILAGRRVIKSDTIRGLKKLDHRLYY